jgi:cytochrome c553
MKIKMSGKLPGFFVTLATVLLLAPAISHAKGNPATGQEKAATCEACHGKDGHSIDPNYPNLAGQHYSYLVKALSDYRSGDRSNAIMASFAANLSNQDIEDLAAWYASQQGLKDLSVK